MSVSRPFAGLEPIRSRNASSAVFRSWALLLK